MKTRNIFIDTQAFMQQGFKFENTVLARISELGRSQFINIYISEVVKEEVSGKIKDKLLKACQLRSDLTKELAILESDIPDLLSQALTQTSDEELIELALSKWYGYIDKSKIAILDPNQICNKELLRYYFSGSFPFSEGKKKNEFPDAISMLSLKAWLNENNQYVYVVSGDHDLQGFCEKEERCISLSQLSEFLDTYNRAEERLTNVVHSYINAEINWVSDAIKEQFCLCGFIYDANYDAEVDDVNIVDFNINEIDVIEVEDGRAVVGLRVWISFSANISGPDYDTAIWDSEDKEYIFINDLNSKMEFNDNYDVSLVVEFDEEEGELTHISETLFDGNKDITLYYDDGFPYK